LKHSLFTLYSSADKFSRQHHQARLLLIRWRDPLDLYLESHPLDFCPLYYAVTYNRNPGATNSIVQEEAARERKSTGI
jgi:hypothetical protein